MVFTALKKAIKQAIATARVKLYGSLLNKVYQISKGK
jgi:hypothetical protein